MRKSSKHMKKEWDIWKWLIEVLLLCELPRHSFFGSAARTICMVRCRSLFSNIITHSWECLHSIPVVGSWWVTRKELRSNFSLLGSSGAQGILCCFVFLPLWFSKERRTSIESRDGKWIQKNIGNTKKAESKIFIKSGTWGEPGCGEAIWICPI